MKAILSVTVVLVTLLTHSGRAAPLLPEQLRLHVAMHLNTDLGIMEASMWFPRTMDGDNYVYQINVPAWGRYPSGASTPSVLVNNSVFTNTPPPYGIEHRTVLPFRGAFNKSYILASGSSSAFPNSAFNLRTNMSRYDFTGSNRVDIVPPWRFPVEYYDWVGTNTIIFTSQNFPVIPALNGRLFLADVTANPFSMTSNTTWNANGYVNTSVTNAGMQVRVGGKYSGYAYYGGDTGGGTNRLFCLEIATGIESALGTANTLSNKYVRMVVERAGYLYVEVGDKTTGNSYDNEIRVYALNSATELGSLYTTYPKDLLDSVTGNNSGQPIWGLDLTPDGHKMILGTKGVAYEVGGIVVNISRSGADIVLSWPLSIAGVIQSSSDLSPGSFADLTPQPVINSVGDSFVATLPLGSGNLFYRLREGP